MNWGTAYDRSSHGTIDKRAVGIHPAPLRRKQMSRKDQDKSLEHMTESLDEGRRAMLKRLLAGGAILAVPVVTSLVAPTEAYADNCGKKGKKGKGKGKGKGPPGCPTP